MWPSLHIEESARARIHVAERFFQALRRIDVAVAIGSTILQQGDLFPVEQSYIAHAVEHRRREFALGRSLARKALGELGLGQLEIPAGADRAPTWPEGIIGSIAHCGDLCVAAVARRSSGLRMIGIDLERIAENADLLDIVSTDHERQRWQCGGTAPSVLATVCFSAKESVYKAIYPSMKQYLDFHDLDLDIHLPGSCFAARLVPQVQGKEEIFEMRGRFSITNEFVMTYATA
jgi:4'-phosphopantetheinyl transferase EntD